MNPFAPPSLRHMNALPGRSAPSAPAPASSEVTSAGRSTSTQCQKPLGVGASGSKQVTVKLLVSSGKPDHDSCGEVLPGGGDLVVLERLAVGDVVAGDGERRHRRAAGRRGRASPGGRESSRLLCTVGVGRTERSPPLWRVVTARGTPAGDDGRRGRSHPPYPSGLRLAGRRVLVVGGGHVAQRRVPAADRGRRGRRRRLARGDAGDRGAGRRGRDHLAPARVRGRATSTAPGTSSRRPTTRRSTRR